MYHVDDVVKNSLAYEAGIKKGDIITYINDEPVTDGLCYGYLMCSENTKIRLSDNREFLFYNDYEDIGIINNRPMVEDPKSCHNKCIFCFIDQLPKGMRDTLYFKDDDARLSFLTGNYVTLTNMSETEFDNIIRQRLSPINISVHTTNDNLRIKMLNNKNAGGILEKIKRLTDENITVNAQIVLCKGCNDGPELEKTIIDLYDAYVNSLSVVPIGLTKFREKLTKIEPFSENDCKNIVKTIENYAQMFYNRSDTHFVYAADEFFVKGKLPLPKNSYYDDFPQIENGVGLLSALIKDFNLHLYRRKPKNINSKKTLLATSYAAYDTLKSLADKFNLKYSAEIEAVKIKNNFFGENVTVAGLLCGCDIIEQLKNKKAERIILPRVILRAEGDLTLDDMTINDIEKSLDCQVTISGASGKELISSMIGE